ncbi:ABC-type dipeptide/oligopeptide/nickel transport system permease component [Litorivivens lipolytica]|uniref:ABC-type dipeptide/oligopeptide/nickel transport system permease component n=1 Tax=Litorivivens lipolytica TaxID=1524264 RepID=A0A7W4Z4Q0_9GAMM|nr:ABC transporter permease [Litorivivens lipolytica]MBB3046714.1 ABC-type dipeptide/oligopeptide/nickel transport system permease component [Litorivivens lipolytica]
MLRYIIKRLAYGLLTIWFIATATFFAMHAVPGDPFNSAKAATPQLRENLRARYGLDKPVGEQYLLYLGNMLQGDFGISFTQENRRVNDIIREHFPVSAILGVVALLIASVGGIAGGAVAAYWHNRLPDRLLMMAVVLAISIPSFVIAALAQLLIVQANDLSGRSLLPVAGWGSLSHLWVPALVLGLGTMAYLARLMRSSMLDVMNTDYVLTARAKGLGTWQIFWRHQLRNALLPVVTELGPTIAAITTGGFVVELIFAIPGLGRYFVQAVQQLDYTVIMGTTVFYGAFLVLIVVLVDLLYGVIDPRIRLHGGQR